ARRRGRVAGGRALGTDATASCHELLLRLAGRLTDRQLWRFRDWLAAGALAALAGSLPLTLLRERVAITSAESMLLNAALVGAGADPGQLNALAWLDEPASVSYTFDASGLSEFQDTGDTVAVVLGAVLQGRPEVVDVRCCWRRHRSGTGAA